MVVYVVVTLTRHLHAIFNAAPAACLLPQACKSGAGSKVPQAAASFFYFFFLFPGLSDCEIALASSCETAVASSSLRPHAIVA